MIAISKQTNTFLHKIIGQASLVSAMPDSPYNMQSVVNLYVFNTILKKNSMEKFHFTEAAISQTSDPYNRINITHLP